MNQLFNTLIDAPMMPLLDPIISHVKSGGVALVVSDTGSGKTLLTPAALCAELDEKILICEPTRFLAMNAASTISDITMTELGEIAGYSVGVRGGDTKKTCAPETPLTFQTYGMALTTQSILRANHVVLDEAHDPQMDITIVSAVLKQRLKDNDGSDDDLNSLIIMSATMDVDEKLEYWKDFNPKVFTAETGSRFSCDMMWEPATAPEEAIWKLIEGGRTGILVFVPGIAEIDEVSRNVMTLQNALPEFQQKTVEILTLHGGSEYEDRVRANSPKDPDVVRILIGTNVMESGVNFPWVDSGVTMGLCREQHVARESGITALVTVPLTVSNLRQQKGRTNRFCDSTFYVLGHVSPDKMSASPTPEIMRIPLTTLHMHCAALGVDPSELEFHPCPDPVKFKDAVTALQYLGFLDEHHELTDAGDFALEVPVGYRTAALLWHANELNILPYAIHLASVFEVGGVRKDLKNAHGLDTSSDYIDGMLAYSSARIIQADKTLMFADRVELMADLNVGKKKYDVAVEVQMVLERSLDVVAQDTLYPEMSPVEKDKLLTMLRQCMLAASLDQIGVICDDLKLYMGGNYATFYGTGASSVVTATERFSPISAVLRKIKPRDPAKREFVIAENITRYTCEDFQQYSTVRPNAISFAHLDNTNETVISVFGKPVSKYSSSSGKHHKTFASVLKRYASGNNLVPVTTVREAVVKIDNLVTTAEIADVSKVVVAATSTILPSTSKSGNTLRLSVDEVEMSAKLLELRNKFSSKR